jgi:hypothetical protein
MKISIVTFPNIPLINADSDKLRGAIATQLFEASSLFHNHHGDKFDYHYPSIQYKSVYGKATVVGIGDDALQAIETYFPTLQTLDIGARSFSPDFELKTEDYTPALEKKINGYQFHTAWMAFNQKNHKELLQITDSETYFERLKSILTANILSFFKGIGYRAEEKIILNIKLRKKNETYFKHIKMKVLFADFYTNAYLPNYIGLGKSCARGFGIIEKIL